MASLIGEHLALGDLEDERRGVEARERHVVGDPLGQLRVEQAAGRHVDAHGEARARRGRRRATRAPAGRPSAEHEGVDLADEPHLFRNGYEQARVDQAAPWMGPPHQRLEPDHGV